jgi:hypothetical protein
LVGIEGALPLLTPSAGGRTCLPDIRETWLPPPAEGNEGGRILITDDDSDLHDPERNKMNKKTIKLMLIIAMLTFFSVMLNAGTVLAGIEWSG